MNAKQREAVKAKIQAFLVASGYTVDRWGHYVKYEPANADRGSKEHYSRYTFSSTKLHHHTKLPGYTWNHRKDALYRNIDLGPSAWGDGKQCIVWDRQCAQEFIVNDLVEISAWDIAAAERGRVFDMDYKSNCLYIQCAKRDAEDDGIREVPLNVGPRVRIIQELAMCQCGREFPINRDGRMSSHAMVGKEYSGALGLCPGTGKMMRNQ